MSLNHSSFISWFIIVLIATTEMATDIYVPSLPQISVFFGVSEAMVQLTISLNLVGIALSGLIYGPLSDVYGRRPVILGGLALFGVASFLCCFTQSIYTLILVRFLQGTGAGVSLVVGLASICDAYSSAQCAKILSRLGMVVALSPGLAPIIGGLIAASYGWQMVFWVVTATAILMLGVFILTFPETRVYTDPGANQLSFKNMGNAYQRLLTNPRFLGYTFIQVITIFWLWGDMANLPFLYIDGMKLPMEHYGYFMAFSVVIFMVGSSINQRYVLKKGANFLLRFGLVLPVISGIALLMAYGMIDLNPVLIQSLKIPSSLGLAFIFGNATTLALEAAGTDRGAGSGLIGALQMLCGAGGIALEGYWYDATIFPLAVIATICSGAALLASMVLDKLASGVRSGEVEGEAVIK